MARKINVEIAGEKLRKAFMPVLYGTYLSCADLANLADLSWCEADAGLAHLGQLGFVERKRDTSTGQWRYAWRTR